MGSAFQWQKAHNPLTDRANWLEHPPIVAHTEFYDTALDHTDLMAEYYSWQSPQGHATMQVICLFVNTKFVITMVECSQLIAFWCVYGLWCSCPFITGVCHVISLLKSWVLWKHVTQTEMYGISHCTAPLWINHKQVPGIWYFLVPFLVQYECIIELRVIRLPLVKFVWLVCNMSLPLEDHYQTFLAFQAILVLPVPLHTQHGS